MTDPDFKRWWRYHRAAFPTLDAWLLGYPEHADGDKDLTRLDILGAWFKALRDVSLEAAKAATDQLACGDEPPPKMPGDHPQAIRRIAKSLAQRKQSGAPCPGKWRDGEWLYDCPHCEDTGMRTIWTSKAVKAMQEGRFGDWGTKGTAAVRCTCERGGNLRLYGAEGYDPKRHCLFDGGVSEAENIARLEAFCGEEKPCGTAWTGAGSSYSQAAGDWP